MTGGPLSCAMWQFAWNDPYENVPPLEGIEWVKFDVQPNTLGLPFAIDIAPTVPAAGPITLQFYDAAGAAGEYYNSPNPDAFDFEGTVPATAAFAVLYPCAAGPGSFTYTAG